MPGKLISLQKKEEIHYRTNICSLNKIIDFIQEAMMLRQTDSSIMRNSLTLSSYAECIFFPL